jgi:hypothetical protein
MGNEQKMTCDYCTQIGTSSNGRIVYFACKCGKTKYARSKEL